MKTKAEKIEEVVRIVRIMTDETASEKEVLDTINKIKLMPDYSNIDPEEVIEARR